MDGTTALGNMSGPCVSYDWMLGCLSIYLGDLGAGVPGRLGAWVHGCMLAWEKWVLECFRVVQGAYCCPETRSSEQSNSMFATWTMLVWSR